MSSPDPKAQDELIVWDSSWRLCVCPCVRPCVHTFKHEYLLDQLADRNQISSGALLRGFGPDRIRTLNPMATDSPHRVIMGKTL